jgi:hypothetical protein
MAGQQEFECKEPGCGQKVIFVYRPTEGMHFGRDSPKHQARTVTAYLKCPSGHAHDYSVELT